MQQVGWTFGGTVCPGQGLACDSTCMHAGGLCGQPYVHARHWLLGLCLAQHVVPLVSLCRSCIWAGAASRTNGGHHQSCWQGAQAADHPVRCATPHTDGCLLHGWPTTACRAAEVAEGPHALLLYIAECCLWSEKEMPGRFVVSGCLVAKQPGPQFLCGGTWSDRSAITSWRINRWSKPVYNVLPCCPVESLFNATKPLQHTSASQLYASSAQFAHRHQNDCINAAARQPPDRQLRQEAGGSSTPCTQEEERCACVCDRPG